MATRKNSAKKYSVQLKNPSGKIVGRMGPFDSQATAKSQAQLLADQAAAGVKVYVVPASSPSAPRKRRNSARGPSAKTFWRDQFKRLDVALPQYDASKVTGFNKVAAHYRGVGVQDAGTPAYWYNEYRGGFKTLEQAADMVAKEMPTAHRYIRNPITLPGQQTTGTRAVRGQQTRGARTVARQADLLAPIPGQLVHRNPARIVMNPATRRPRGHKAGCRCVVCSR